MYRRKLQLPGQEVPNPNSISDPKSSLSEKGDIEANENVYTVSIPPKKTYLQELKVYNGVNPTRASVLTLLLRPFVACLTPVCLWAGLVYGIAITWLVLIATSVAQLFSAPRKYTHTYFVTFVF